MKKEDLQYYRIINKISENQSCKESYISEMSQDYNKARENAIYRFDVLINSIDAKDVFINELETSIKGVIDISRKQTADTEMEERLQVYPNLIKRGDYVKFKVNDTDTLRTYLIKSKIDKKNGYDEGIFEECNYNVKFISSNELNKIMAIVSNNTKYTLGIKSLVSGIIEANGMFGLIMSDNSISQKISLGQRFIINKQAWKATQTDRVTVPGILIVLLGESNINVETDDVVNEIADALTHNYTIALNSTSQSIVENGTYEINPIVKDNGKEVDNSNVTYLSSNPEIATIDSKGLVTALKTGTCIITCSIGTEKIDLSLSVIAKTTIPVINYTTTSIVKTVDGIADNSLVVNYNFDSIGQSLISQKKLTITKVSDTSFTIKNTNTSVVTNISIDLIDSSNGTIIETKNIQLKGVS